MYTLDINNNKLYLQNADEGINKLIVDFMNLQENFSAIPLMYVEGSINKCLPDKIGELLKDYVNTNPKANYNKEYLIMFCAIIKYLLTFSYSIQLLEIGNSDGIITSGIAKLLNYFNPNNKVISLVDDESCKLKWRKNICKNKCKEITSLIVNDENTNYKELNASIIIINLDTIKDNLQNKLNKLILHESKLVICYGQDNKNAIDFLQEKYKIEIYPVSEHSNVYVGKVINDFKGNSENGIYKSLLERTNEVIEKIKLKDNRSTVKALDELENLFIVNRCYLNNQYLPFLCNELKTSVLDLMFNYSDNDIKFFQDKVTEKKIEFLNGINNEKFMKI